TTPLCTTVSGMCRICLSNGNRPRLGFNPTSPLQDAGIRIDPPPPLGCAIGTTPAEPPRATPRPNPRVLARPAEPELRQLRLPQRDQPGGEEHTRELAIGTRRRGRPCVRALHRRHPRDVDIVFDERRHTSEKS